MASSIPGQQSNIQISTKWPKDKRVSPVNYCVSDIFKWKSHQMEMCFRLSVMSQWGGLDKNTFEVLLSFHGDEWRSHIVVVTETAEESEIHLPPVQLSGFPTHVLSLHVKNHISCVALQRTVASRDVWVTWPPSGGLRRGHPRAEWRNICYNYVCK